MKPLDAGGWRSDVAAHDGAGHNTAPDYSLEKVLQVVAFMDSAQRSKKELQGAAVGGGHEETAWRKMAVKDKPRRQLPAPHLPPPPPT